MTASRYRLSRDQRIGRLMLLRQLRGARPIITRSITPKTTAERLAEWRYAYELHKAIERAMS